MLNKVEQLNLGGYPQPERNGSSSVADALNRVITAYDQDSSWSAYSELLFAVGNNHAGTYCPVVLAIIPVLEDILRDDNPWPRHSVLNVLIDLCGSFQPDGVHSYFRGEPLRTLLIQSVAMLLPTIQQLSVSECMVAQDAMALCQLLDRRISEL